LQLRKAIEDTNAGLLPAAPAPSEESDEAETPLCDNNDNSQLTVVSVDSAVSGESSQSESPIQNNNTQKGEKVVTGFGNRRGFKRT